MELNSGSRTWSSGWLEKVLLSIAIYSGKPSTSERVDVPGHSRSPAGLLHVPAEWQRTLSRLEVYCGAGSRALGRALDLHNAINPFRIISGDGSIKLITVWDTRVHTDMKAASKVSIALHVGDIRAIQGLVTFWPFVINMDNVRMHLGAIAIPLTSNHEG